MENQAEVLYIFLVSASQFNMLFFLRTDQKLKCEKQVASDCRCLLVSKMEQYNKKKGNSFTSAVFQLLTTVLC